MEDGMNHRLYLYTPQLSDLWYRQKILGDPDTMGYNKGYHLDFAGYHNDTGCIDFPKAQWKEWHDWFVGHTPTRFYAYITRKEDNAFIGEVNLHQSRQGDWHDMGIVIEGKHRGKGYAVEALYLLLKEAFEHLSVTAVHNDFEKTRAAAVNAHLAVGFQIQKEENGVVNLCMLKEQYFARQGGGQRQCDIFYE